MDSTLIPKIQAPKIEPLNIDVPASFPNTPTVDLPTVSKEDPIKRAERSVLNSPKIDFGKIENQYQNKYVPITPDKLEGLNKGEDITERINFDENFQAVKRQTQGEWERVGNTAKKFGAAATSSFLGGLATIPNIFGSVVNGIGYLSGKDKPISEFFNLGWDSGINKTLADFNDEVNKNSINYKSNWSKDNWIEDMIPFWGDGGFQDIVASSGYTAGAIAEFALSGGIASVLSKGTKLAGLGGRISKYLNSPEKLDKVINAFKVINKEDDVRKIIGEAGYLIGKGIEKSPQLYRAYVGAHVEAAFEGIEGAKRFEEEAIKMYKEKNFGMSPDEKTLQNIKAISQEVGDMRYKLNLAVLTVPNYLQMGALLKTFPGAEKVSKMLMGNNLIGEIQSDAGKFVVKKAKDVKLDWNPSGKAAKYLKKGLEKGIQYGQEYGKIPLSFSEGGEEYMQYIIDEYTSSLYKGVYLNPEKSKDVGEYLSQMFTTLSEKGTSKEAAQSFLMGSVGGGIQQSFNTGVEIATNSNRLKNKIATNEIIAERLEELSKSIFSSEGLANTMLDEDKEYLKEILSESLNQNSLSGTLEDRYTNALSGLNNLSVMEDVLKSGSIDSQRWYYNLKDRHLSQILHNVVSSGKQDVFREHLQELASSEPSAINELYGIKIEEQTRNHKEFVNDVLEKLNRIENNSKIINFSFNDIFEDLDKSNKYEQYKSELSHLKYTIDRQKERMNGLKSPTTDKISRFLTGDFSDIENRINTLSLVQKDTQDYSEAMKELARMKDALSSAKKAFIYSNEEGEVEKINFSKLADVLNKLDNTNDNTELSVFEDFRKVSDMIMIEVGLSDKSTLMKRYKQLYSDKGFDIYLKERENEIEKLQKLIEEASSKEEIKNKVEKELETVPQAIKENVEKEVDKKVEDISKLPEIEQKEAIEKLPEVVNEIVENQLPNIKKEEEIIKELKEEKMVFDFLEEEQKLIEDKKLVDVVNNDVLDSIADIIQPYNSLKDKKADIERRRNEELDAQITGIETMEEFNKNPIVVKINAKYDAELADLEKENEIPKEEQEEIKKENTTSIDNSFEEKLPFDETNFFLNEEATKKSQLTEKEKLQAENMMLKTGKLPVKVKDEFLFQIGGYKVFSNEKSILGINGKRLTQKEIDEFNKLLNLKGWNINKKLTNGRVDLTNGKYLVEVDSYVPPQTPVDSQPSITSNDNLFVLQNDFYLNDTGIGKLDKKKGNEMLLKRRAFLNSIDNINNIQWELKLESRDLKGKKLNFQYLFNKKLIKINEAPFFTIQAKNKEEDIIIQEFRDVRNGMLISKQFLSESGIEILNSFNISSKNILNADNINSLNDYVSFYSVIEHLKQTDENRLDELVEKLEIKPSYFSELIRNQELYELALKNKNNIKLERMLTNYASSTNLQNASLHANYNDVVKIEHLPNSMVIDENGNQYTAILDVNVPYEIAIEEGETVKEKLRDKLELNIRNGVFYGTIPFDLQQKIKDDLISQLNEEDFAPVDFLSNGFNLIFTGTDKLRPYVKPILSKIESIPSTTDIIEGIREGNLVGDVRTNGWFINLSGIQEQLSTKFEVAKIEYNKYTLKNDGDMDGITILFVYKDEQGNNVYFRKNYSLVTNTSLNTINFLTPRIKADLKKEFKDLDIDKISVNFVNSNPRKPTTYEGIVANNPFVIKGIEFINTDKETKSVKWDMRNNTAYSFQHDRIVPVLNKKTNKTKVKKTDEFASTPKNKKKTIKKEKEVVKEQKVVVVDVSNESDLIKFLNQFKEIILQESKDGDITTINLNSENYNIVESILENYPQLNNTVKNIISNDKLPSNIKKDSIVAILKTKFKELHTLTCK